MKLIIVICALIGASVPAFASFNEEVLSAVTAKTHPFNLVNWAVGDSADFQVTLGSFGTVGTVSKVVQSEETTENALWVKTTMDLTVQKDESEMLIRRSDAKILKYVHNGKEEAIPDDKVEIVSQSNAEIDVPAGHFRSLHIVANTKDVKGVEIWINPRETVMDGTLKQLVPSQYGNIEMVLTKFHKEHILWFPPCEIQPCSY